MDKATKDLKTKIDCLKELSEWMERYGVELGYTINDDGIHVDFSREDWSFMGDSVAIGFDREYLDHAISQLENS